MSINKVMFTSNTDVWATPQALFDELNQEYKFTLDVCALPENAKCAVYFTPDQDGLKQAWRGRCWMNPPYGRTIGKWIKKAYDEVNIGNAEILVALLPARTDTKWFHDYIYGKCQKLVFIKGRLKFGNSVNSAPFPNMLVVWQAA